jgi:hypothetical protein
LEIEAAAVEDLHFIVGELSTLENHLHQVVVEFSLKGLNEGGVNFQGCSDTAKEDPKRLDPFRF